MSFIDGYLERRNNEANGLRVFNPVENCNRFLKIVTLF